MEEAHGEDNRTTRQPAFDSAMMARRLSGEARRALKILADSPDGANQALLVYGHGFKRQTLAGLIPAGFATAECDVVKTGEKTIEIIKVRITAAGRQATEA
jgi:hypothetical protein